MDKEKIIKLRKTLKTVGNLPLRVFINNAHTIIDESLKTQFTIWDDNNGLIYSFRMIGMQEDDTPNNIQQAISLFVADYEEIQAMEIVRLPIDDIDATIGGMINAGAKVTDEFRKRITYVYKELLHPGRFRMSPTDVNNMLGSSRLQEGIPDAVNEKDDYYAGKFTESFQETHAVNAYNASIKNGETKTP